MANQTNEIAKSLNNLCIQINQPLHGDQQLGNQQLDNQEQGNQQQSNQSGGFKNSHQSKKEISIEYIDMKIYQLFQMNEKQRAEALKKLGAELDNGNFNINAPVKHWDKYPIRNLVKHSVGNWGGYYKPDSLMKISVLCYYTWYTFVPEILEFLIARGADPNLRFDQGENYMPGNLPIEIALRSGYFEAVKFLCKNGADVNTKCIREYVKFDNSFPEFLTPLEVIMYCPVKKPGGDSSHFQFPNAKSKWEMIHFLLEAGASATLSFLKKLNVLVLIN